jgi:hypothetical protein
MECEKRPQVDPLTPRFKLTAMQLSGLDRLLEGFESDRGRLPGARSKNVHQWLRGSYELDFLIDFGVR